LLIKCPKYLTFSSTNCNLVFETFHPWQPKKFRRLIVVSVTCFLVSPDNRRSSTYCNKFIWEGRANSSSTCSKTWPNSLGESVKPCGRTAHLYYCFLPAWGSSHPKAKMSLLSSGRGQAQKASFKSTTLNHQWSGGILLRRV
jgi:hypothetical protein